MSRVRIGAIVTVLAKGISPEVFGVIVRITDRHTNEELTDYDDGRAVSVVLIEQYHSRGLIPINPDTAMQKLAGSDKWTIVQTVDPDRVRYLRIEEDSGAFPSPWNPVAQLLAKAVNEGRLSEFDANESWRRYSGTALDEYRCRCCRRM